MSDVKKVSEEQLTALKELNAQYEFLTKRYGELVFETKVVEAAMVEFNQNRNAMIQALEAEFGQGEVDLSTGEFKQQ